MKEIILSLRQALPLFKRLLTKLLEQLTLWKQEKRLLPRTIHVNIPVDKAIAWFDGATQQRGEKSGVGGKIMINNNTSYLWTFNCGQGTNTRAELLGAWASLTLAIRLSISDLLLLGDSKIVIEWLNKRGTIQAVALESWKERILETLPLFRNISYAHIYREENKEADRLSKLALSNLPGSIAFTRGRTVMRVLLIT
jgi:ribonuclease HI